MQADQRRMSSLWSPESCNFDLNGLNAARVRLGHGIAFRVDGDATMAVQSRVDPDYRFGWRSLAGVYILWRAAKMA